VDGGASGSVDHGPAAACATTRFVVASRVDALDAFDALCTPAPGPTGVDVINACTGRSGIGRGVRSRVRLRRARAPDRVVPVVINAT
jgi:hypothetical protein